MHSRRSRGQTDDRSRLRCAKRTTRPRRGCGRNSGGARREGETGASCAARAGRLGGGVAGEGGRKGSLTHAAGVVVPRDSSFVLRSGSPLPHLRPRRLERGRPVARACPPARGCRGPRRAVRVAFVPHGTVVASSDHSDEFLLPHSYSRPARSRGLGGSPCPPGRPGPGPDDELRSPVANPRCSAGGGKGTWRQRPAFGLGLLGCTRLPSRCVECSRCLQGGSIGSRSKAPSFLG